MSEQLPLLKVNSTVKSLSSVEKTEASPVEPVAGEPTAEQKNVLSVEQLNVYIRQLLEGQVGVVWVKGELSNFKAHTSGHFYFSIKDAKAQVNAVMFRGHNSKLRFKPTDGMEVLVRGRISVYEPRGTYQITCDLMEPVGAGALQKAFEQLKDKLKKEGLFESARKRALPPFPRHVAIVTSPTGAAIRDILNVMQRRAKNVQITLVPTIVQGEGSGEMVRQALIRAQMLRDVDVIIVGRGGGSMEDLWGFNDEALAREIAACRVPVISAVGHEIDFTIADFVADLRAPTPSAAAELVAKSSQEVVHKLEQLDRILKLSLDKMLRLAVHKLAALTKQLVDPQKKLQDLSQRNDDLTDRLQNAVGVKFRTLTAQVNLMRQKLVSPEAVIQAKRSQLQMQELRLKGLMDKTFESGRGEIVKWASVLDSLSPLKVVERGYSIVSKDNEIIKSIKQVKVGDRISVKLAHGELKADIVEL